MNVLEQFKKQKYLNLETFPRSGESMKTPVWFVQDDDTMYIQTVANSAKVKRIRNNGSINITPCQMDGTPNGSWVPAIAREVTSMEITKKVNCLLEKKIWPDKKVVCLASHPAAPCGHYFGNYSCQIGEKK